MNPVVVVVVKVLMFKRYILLLLLIQPFGILIAQSNVLQLGSDFEIKNFNQCQQNLLFNCKNKSASCFNTLAPSIPVCQQTAKIIKITDSVPLKVENYGKINVVKSFSLNDSSINYFIVGNNGEIILPTASITLEQAPGFFELKQLYPSSTLSSRILSFPDAVFLTENIQKLLMRQSIIEPGTLRQVGYAKILYSFSINGQFQGAQVMRIVSKK